MNVPSILGDRPFWRDALRLALPVAIQNMLTSSFQLIDTLMVGQLGDLTLSAVGMAGQWSWLMNMVLFGACSGMSVLASQYWGVRDMKGIHRVFGIALLFCLSVGGVFLGVALCLPAGVIGLFNQEPDVIATGAAYLKIACWSYPALAVMNVFSMLLRTVERAPITMYLSIFSTLTNAALNACLIFGKLGLPAMGAQGAALATVISAWLGPILVWIVSMKQKNELIAPAADLFGFGKAELALFFKKAAPVIANETTWGLGMVTLNTIFANLGYEYYAAVTIQSTFMDLAFTFFIGLCSACIIMVGKSVGQGNIRHAVTDSRRFMLLIPLTSLIITVLTVLLRDQLVQIFNLSGSISAQTVSTAREILVLRVLEYPLQMACYALVVGVYRGGGNTLTVMILELICLWAISIPVTWVCANILHLPFAWVFLISRAAEDLPKYVYIRWNYHQGKWLKPVTKEGIEGLAAYRAEQAKD